MTFAFVLKTYKDFAAKQSTLQSGSRLEKSRLVGESCYRRNLKQSITGEAENFLWKSEVSSPFLAVKEVIQGKEDRKDFVQVCR